MSFVQTIVTALLLGGVYALVASGLSLIFGVMRVLNFAQGSFLMLGMYLAYEAWRRFELDPFVAAVPVAVILFFFGAIFSLGLLERIPGRHDAQLLLTLGAAIVLDNGALLVFGAEPKAIATSYSAEAYDVGGILMNKARLYTLVAAVVIIAALSLFLRRTTIGRSMRALADNPTACALCGVDVRAVNTLAFGLGAALAGLGGSLLMSFYPASPEVGYDFVLIMFLAVVLGGLGSVIAPAVAAVAIAGILGFAELLLPLRLQNLAVFVLFLLVLFVRPQGFVGVRIRGETVG